LRPVAGRERRERLGARGVHRQERHPRGARPAFEPMSFAGRVAFVTGAAHGQGASHALHLAREGARIAALDICHDIPTIYPLGTRAELEETVAAIRAEGSEAIAIEADVRSV